MALSAITDAGTTVAALLSAVTPIRRTAGEGATPPRVVLLAVFVVDPLFSSSSSFIDGSFGGAEIDPLF
ncbi:unnamed protein product [Toxocara canis]|uniref:Secreted protein n=1 Tax=Toxocara canis TaxID=6265 RepID=A0A183VEY2_TOXCA|nr:unnamed protein product [Toxocara canis]